MSTTTTTAAATTSKQKVIAVSERVKTWVKDTSGSYSAPSKSKPEGMDASERETLDAMVSFVELYRYQQAPTLETVILNEGTPEETSEEIETFDEDGELITHEVDLFEAEIYKVLAERMEITRTNSASVKLKSAEDEIAALRKELAKLQGKPEVTE